jgi:hypothetical protein
MGSRAVVIVCRDEQTARDRFGVTEGEIGIVYTRSGRRFFNETELERQFLDRLRAALTGTDLWTTLETIWVCLDCELMPWSAKAQELLKTQYAAVGAAGRASLPRAVATLTQSAGRLAGAERDQIEKVIGVCRSREEHIGRFVAAYRQYCWPVLSLTDLKLAPFHLLASEGRVHTDKNHTWHMETLAAVCRQDPELLRATAYKLVDVTDPASQAEGVEWWTELTGRGGEGMVVKPLDFILRGQAGPRSTRCEMPGPGVPAHHLRPRLYRRREPVPLAEPRAGPQALPCPRGVRPRDRRVATVYSPGTAAARA